ncbi:hypothetical protein H2199_009007 [Coniosporium tulheliwenetii]|uniref:Uncharacterized protein n=1 Tax=Coniosporium tulheliwenetii TaxID=3383036 RepID=A0ACC2YGV1_9PEZI|nr:hypothetical protein H2199_009007 [Cladosporium sp. JES 115]
MPPSPKGAKLTIYVDCALQAHGVHVEITPFFLGGARDSAGNPWMPTPKWKEAFSKQDSEMTGKLLGLETKQPKEFPILSLFAVRVATWVKDHYPDDKFEDTFLALVSGYWNKGINIAKPEGILEALSDVFPKEEIEEIMQKAVTPENKKIVIDRTMASGAFGAPWIVGVTSEGDKKMWFGNDRWEQVFAHLGVPYSPLAVLPPKESKL